MPVQLNQTPPAPSFWESCSSRLYELTEVIVQLAMRVLFVMTNVLMSAAILPLGWHWLAIPAAGLGSATIAAFFFPQFQLANMVAPCLNVFRPTPYSQYHPAHYPDGSPVGHRNRGGNDCPYNAVAHFLDADAVSSWVRKEIPTDLEPFLTFLQDYSPPEGLVDAFRQFMVNPPPNLPTPQCFLRFLSAHQPSGELRGEFEKLFLLLSTLNTFYRENDAAVRERKSESNCDSRTLRAAVNRMLGLSSAGPEDAIEIAEAILDKAPLDTKAQVQMPSSNPERIPIIRLGMTSEDGKGSPPTLVDLINRQGVSFLNAPKSLRFQINRTAHKVCEQGFLDRLVASKPTAQTVMLQVPVTCPEEIRVIVEGTTHTYRLKGFIRSTGGHFISGEVRVGHKFLENDATVTLVIPTEEAQWGENLRASYLLSYERVDAPPAPNAPG